MQRSVVFALMLMLVATMGFALVSRRQANAQASTIAGTASVVDGDTIEIHGERIRLSGFDAPESGSRCGRINVYNRAANSLSDFIGSRTVTCQVTGRDAYGRITADCSVDGIDMGDHMVSSGWARDWPRYSNGRYARAEAGARVSQLGIWGMVCPANLWGNRDYSAVSATPAIPAPGSTAAMPLRTEREYQYVTASALNVRAGAGAEHQVIDRLQHGARVGIMETNGEWTRVVTDQGAGWVSSAYLSDNQPAAPQQSDAQIRRAIMEQSLTYYSGRCPCPYNVDRAGRRCGGRSAYSRPGGASPLCYPSDVSDAQVQAFRSRTN
jgi:endonuclease YncB( thermonuclease family)